MFAVATTGILCVIASIHGISKRAVAVVCMVYNNVVSQYRIGGHIGYGDLCRGQIPFLTPDVAAFRRVQVVVERPGIRFRVVRLYGAA